MSTPHEASRTAGAISTSEHALPSKGGATRAATRPRTCWPGLSSSAVHLAIGSASGLGYLLAQQLVAAGDTVVEVPGKLASRARVLSRGRSNRNDANDVRAVAALRSPDRRRVGPAANSRAHPASVMIDPSRYGWNRCWSSGSKPSSSATRSSRSASASQSSTGGPGSPRRCHPRWMPRVAPTLIGGVRPCSSTMMARWWASVGSRAAGRG